MKIQSKTFKNGLKVVVAYTPYLHKSSISLQINGGSMYESKEKTGVFHLCEHSILLGSKKYPNAVLLADELEKSGIFHDFATTQESVTFQFTFHKILFKKATALLYEIISNPLFIEEEIELEKERIKGEEQFVQNDNHIFFDRLVDEYLFFESGIKKDILGNYNNLTKKDIKECFDKYFIPNNMVISYVGGYETKKVFDYIEKTFGRLKAGRKIKKPKIKFDFKNKLGYVKKITNVPNDFKYLSFILPIKYTKKNNSDLVFLFYKTLELKIEKVLIVEKKISYDVDVFIEEFLDFAIIKINSGFNNNSKEIIKTIKDILKNFSVEDGEFNILKKKIMQQIDYVQDVPKVYADYLSENFLAEETRGLKGEKKDLLNISVKEVNNFAKKILKNENFAIFIANGEV